MTKHNCSPNVKPIECFPEQVRLRLRGPNDVPGPQAVPKSRAIEDDHPVILSRQINQAARFEILDHAAVAVKENQRSSIATLHIVQTNPVDVDEPPLRWIIALRFLGKMPVRNRRHRHKSSGPSKGSDCRMSPEGDETVGQQRVGTCLRQSHTQYLRWPARCLKEMRNVADRLQWELFVPIAEHGSVSHILGKERLT